MPSRLYQIQENTRLRAEEIVTEREDWPCRKGCADCCRHLAAEPRVSLAEWTLIAQAIDALPAEVADAARQRIRETAGRARPVVCPLLDADTDACLIYEARPVACRAYGFYAQRREVLGCHRIEAIAEQATAVIWGNHTSLENELAELGPAKEFSAWLPS